MYHVCKPVDNNKKRIVICVLPINKYGQSHLNYDLYELANDNKNRIITGAFSIYKYGYLSQIYQ